MDCLFVRDHLFSYQEQQLSGEEQKEFEEHLHSCEECNRIANGFQSVATIMDKKKSVEPNPFIRTRTIQRIESALEKANEPRYPLFRRSLQPVLISILLMIALAIGFSVGKKLDTTLSMNNDHHQEIQKMKSELFIQDFIDEDEISFTNN